MNSQSIRERLQDRIGDEMFRWWLITVVVTSIFSFSIVYANVMTYDPVLTPATGYSDTAGYLDIYAGGTGEGMGPIGSYRPLVPELAALLPDPPRAIFSDEHPFTWEAMAAAKFGLLNLFFLIGACLAMFAFQLALGFVGPEAFLGVVLFLSTKEVIRSAGLPIIDTAFYFFFLLCLVAVVKDRPWFLMAAAAVGVSSKELILLVIPLILLTLLPWRRRIILLAAMVPAVLVYAGIRFFYAPTAVDPYVTGGSLGFFDDQIRVLFTPNGIVNVVLAFGVCWLFAAYALLKADVPPVLRRWAWFVPIVFLGVLLGAGNLGRSTFTAFPVVVPLAAAGLWHLGRSRPEHAPGRGA